MSDAPKPPFGFPTFLDYYVGIDTLPEWKAAACSELAALRQKVAEQAAEIERLKKGGAK